MKIIIFFLLLLPTLVFSKEGHATQYENPFSIVYGGSGNSIYGDYVSIASSIQCVKNGNGGCDNNYNGNLFDADTKYKNSVLTSVIPLNSSTETLSLPNDIDGEDIVYAGIYWQGNISGKDADDYNSNFSSTNQHGGIIGRDQITMRDANGTIHQLTADKIWYHDFWGNGTGTGGGHRSFYQGYKEITSIVSASYSKGQTNTYTFGNIKSTIGTDFGTYFWGDAQHAYNGVRIGFWGNWNLIIVYRHPSVIGLSPQPKAKSITIFQGFDALIPLGTGTTKSINLNLSGFLTPLSIPAGQSISAKLLFYGAGGEKNLHYDSFQIQDKKSTNFADLSNATNPIDDAFNGSVSQFGVPIDSSISYYPGLDSDDFDVSAYMDTKQSSTTLALSAYNVGGTGDQIFPGLIAFSTDIFEPEFCYDYAYKQQGVYFTEDNNGSHDARLTTDKLPGGVIPNEPIDVTIYLKSLVDTQVDITDLSLNVLDINTSQVSYISGTTKLAKTGELNPTTISDSSSTTSANIKDVYAGTFKSNEYAYLYYQLNPTQKDLNTSITVQVNYNISVDSGTPIPYSHKIGASHKIQMCSSSNFTYKPVDGVFNIVHKDFYNNTYTYYNIPTQVTSRVGKFKAIALDYPDNPDTLKPITTQIAIEMIDSSPFHDTQAACTEITSKINNKVWITINGTEADLNSTAFPSSFYAHATNNAAFRISYNLDSDNNLTVLECSNSNDTITNNCSPGGWKLKNFTASQGEPCLSGPIPTVPAACGSNGNGGGNSGMNDQEVTQCMECIYGKRTKFICSKDNFAIRPEAFLIQIDDQNQTNPSMTSDITHLTDSGASGAISSQLHLAAGYQYKIEINATNHLNNIASPGYTRTMNLDNNNIAKYIWSPQSLLTCNNEDNQSINIDNTVRFLNGFISMNTFLNEVGLYLLTIKDTTWTTVDSDLATMQHHFDYNTLHSGGPYFTNTIDCDNLSSGVKAIGAIMNPNNTTTLNGCNISSQHLNVDNLIQYNDYNVTFHPYKFDLNATNGMNPTPITPTIGLLFTPIPSTTPYIYISDINETLDENMSYHLNGSINALGENNVTLTNFVDKCYAVALDINISTSNRDLNDSNGNHVDYRVRFHDLNATGSVITALDINVTDTNTTSHTADILLQTVQTSTKGYFPKNLNGTMQTRLNMNYVREKETTVNPTTLTFVKYQVNCTNALNDCTFNADLTNNKTTQGTKDLNSTIPIRHYYGRTHAPRQTITGSDGNVSIYYEVFCNGATCNKALLQDGIDSNTTDDPRWFVNTRHSNEAGTAAQTATIQKNASNVTITREANGNHPDYIEVHYNGNSGYPYKATMENNASGWLIYNKYNPNAATNEFEVEFVKPGGDWAGMHETNATTNKNATENTNRRLMW